MGIVGVDTKKKLYMPCKILKHWGVWGSWAQCNCWGFGTKLAIDTDMLIVHYTDGRNLTPVDTANISWFFGVLAMPCGCRMLSITSRIPIFNQDCSRCQSREKNVIGWSILYNTWMEKRLTWLSERSILVATKKTSLKYKFPSKDTTAHPPRNLQTKKDAKKILLAKTLVNQLRCNFGEYLLGSPHKQHSPPGLSQHF